MQRGKYLAKNTALFALNSIGTRLITFFLVPIYTRAFITSEYGGVDLITTISTILIPIITINIGESVMRFSLDDDSDRDGIISVGLLFAILSLLLGLSVFPILSIFSQIVVKPYIVYLYCVSQGIYQTMSCNLRGQERLLQYAVGNIISVFLSALLNIVFLLVFKWGINGYFLAYCISFTIAAAYCAFASRILSSLKRFHIKMTLLVDMVKYSIVLVPNSLMWWIMNSSDHLMVTAMIGIDANGIYGVSYKLPSILSALSMVFNQAWSYSAIHENKSKDRVSFNNNMFDRLARFQLLTTVVLMCVVKPFMKIYVETAYYSAWEYMPYLLAGNFFLTLSTFLSTFYTVNKDSKGFLYSGSLGAIINLVLNWLLIPRFGVHGAAFATFVSYVSVFIYRYKDTQKYMRIEVFKLDLIFGYIVLILTSVSMFLGGWIGQSVLLVEVLLVIIINRGFINECWLLFAGIAKRVLKKV